MCDARPGALTDLVASVLKTRCGTAPRTGLGDLGLVASGRGKSGALRLISPKSGLGRSWPGLAEAEVVSPSPPYGVKPGVGIRPPVLGLRSFATSTPLPSDAFSSSKSLPSSLSSGPETALDPSCDGAFGRTTSRGSGGRSDFEGGSEMVGSGGRGASGTAGFETLVKSGGKGASSISACSAVFAGFVTSDASSEVLGAFGVAKSGGNGAASGFDAVPDIPNGCLGTLEVAEDDDEAPRG